MRIINYELRITNYQVRSVAERVGALEAQGASTVCLVGCVACGELFPPVCGRSARGGGLGGSTFVEHKMTMQTIVLRSFETMPAPTATRHHVRKPQDSGAPVEQTPKR